MAQTLTEKIAQKYTMGLLPDHEVHSGDYLMIKPAYVMIYPVDRQTELRRAVEEAERWGFFNRLV